MTTNRPEYLREWRKRHPLTDAQREQNRIRWERWFERNHGKDTDLDKQLSLLPDVPAVEVEDKVRLIGWRQVIPYHEFWSLGVSFSSGKFNLAGMIRQIRIKRPDVEIQCLPKKGYIYYKGGEVQAELPTQEKKPVKKECNCHKYQTCLICRNAEKRRAFKAGEIPVYRLTILTQITAAHGD